LTITQPDIRLKKNGGAWAQKNAAQTLSHEEFGWYEVSLDATDTNALGILTVAVYEVGALPVWQHYMVLSAQVYDALVTGGANYLPVDAQKWLGQVIGAVDTAGYPKVTIKDGSAQGEILTTSGAIDSVTTTATASALAANSITAAVIANGAIDAATFAAGAIDAAAIANGAIDRATFATDTGLQSVRASTALNGGSSTIDLDAGASAIDDFYNDCWIYLTSGAGVGQSRRIRDYDGVFKTVSVSPVWITNPAAGTEFVILPFGRVDLGGWTGITPLDLTSQLVQVSVAAMAVDVITATALNANAVTEIQAGLATAAALAIVQADTDDIQARLPAALIGGRMDSDVEAINASTEAADDLQFSAATIVRGTVVADAGNSTTQMKTNLTPATNDHYKDRKIYFTSGVLADQATSISTYDGTTKILTFPAITSVPAADVTFVIV
jgi:hypothetical protein